MRLTVAPHKPNLDPIDGKPRFKILKEDHLTTVKLPFAFTLSIMVRKGYSTDGASVPEGVSEEICGTPWDMPRLLAAIVHDALYSIKWKCRWLCDQIYRLILVQNGYGNAKASIEYSAIRIGGLKRWKSVTKEEKRWARNLVEVKLIPTQAFNVYTLFANAA